MTVRREGPGTAKVLATLEGLDGLEGKVGWFESAHYPGGTPVAYVATIHEFGTGRIPARPFMRPAVADHGGEWLELIGQGVKASMMGGQSPAEVLELVMLQAAGNVGEKIQAVTSPALSPVTIKRKGHEKPLVDTGQMIQSVTGKVERTN
jgi:hypothetical protein